MPFTPLLLRFRKAAAATRQKAANRRDAPCDIVADVLLRLLVGDGVAVAVMSAEQEVGRVVQIQEPAAVFGDPLPRVLGMRQQPAAQLRNSRTANVPRLAVQPLIRRACRRPCPLTRLADVDPRPPGVVAVEEGVDGPGILSRRTAGRTSPWRWCRRGWRRSHRRSAQSHGRRISQLFVYPR